MQPLPPRMDSKEEHGGRAESLSQVQESILEQTSQEQAKGAISLHFENI